MKSLLKNWAELKKLFSEPLFFITDYDGTLTPIVDAPEEADLSSKMRERLVRLKDNCPVGIVSGRSLSNLKSKVGIEGIYYSGNHGYEIEGPDLKFLKREAKRAEPAIKEICESIEKKFNTTEGVLVENKKFTASIHYRLVEKSDIPRVKEIVEEEVEPYKKRNIVETSYGKKVFEIRPKLDWDKGKAVSLLRDKVGFDKEGTTIYLGDDETDEDVFRGFDEGGVGILVSEKDKESSAEYRLNGVEEVGRFIDELTTILGKPQG